MDRILLDIETQNDFFTPGGSCHNGESAKVAKQIGRLFDWVRHENIPVISTVLRVRRFDRGPLSPRPHCIEGTEGEAKLSGTILRRRIDFGLRNVTDLPKNLFGKYQQAIFEKRDTDIFVHARLERLITELPRVTFVVCGAGLAQGIAQATVGLRSRGFGVIVATDAVLDMGDRLSDMARLRMEAKGAIFAPTGEIIIPTPKRKSRPFRVPSIQEAKILARSGRK